MRILMLGFQQFILPKVVSYKSLVFDQCEKMSLKIIQTKFPIATINPDWDNQIIEMIN